MKNLLLIYDCLYPQSLGGVEHRNYALAKALRARGHRVTLAGWGEATDIGIPTTHLPFQKKLHDKDGKRGLIPTLLFALAMLRLDLKPYDAVETANIPYLHLFPLALKCALAKKPLIVTWYEFFGPSWRDYKNPLTACCYALVERLALRLGTRWVNSLHTKNRMPLLTPKPALLYNGVSLDEIRQVQKRPAIPAPTLLYAGRLIPEKQLDLLLQAMVLLPETITLGIVGDGTERQTLEKLATSLGLTHRVTFYGKLPDIRAMWHLLAHTKLAVQPSRREGFGLFPLEALALGKPVIYCISPDNAIGEIVQDGGVATAPSPDALAEAIKRLLNNQELYLSTSRAATTRAAGFDWSRIAERAELLLNMGVGG